MKVGVSRSVVIVDAITETMVRQYGKAFQAFSSIAREPLGARTLTNLGTFLLKWNKILSVHRPGSMLKGLYQLGKVIFLHYGNEN